MYNSDHVNQKKMEGSMQHFPGWHPLPTQPSKEQLRNMLREAVENTRKQEEK